MVQRTFTPNLVEIGSEMRTPCANTHTHTDRHTKSPHIVGMLQSALNACAKGRAKSDSRFPSATIDDVTFWPIGHYLKSAGFHTVFGDIEHIYANV